MRTIFLTLIISLFFQPAWSQTQDSKVSTGVDKIENKVKSLEKKIGDIRGELKALKKEMSESSVADSAKQKDIFARLDKMEKDLQLFARNEVAFQESMATIKHNLEFIANAVQEQSDYVSSSNERLDGVAMKLRDIEDAVHILRQEQVRQSEDWKSAKDKRKKDEKKFSNLSWVSISTIVLSVTALLLAL